MAHSEVQIACGLLARKFIQQHEFDVWIRSRAGAGQETIFSIRKDYPRESRPGRDGLMASSTLYVWVEKVNREIETQRIIAREDNRGIRRGHTVASGSRTRRTGDPTGSGFVPVDYSSWNQEQLKRYGLLDRWSRKLEVFIVKRAYRKKTVVNSTERADRDYREQHEK